MTAKTDTKTNERIDRRMNRRKFLRTVGVTAGSAAVVGSGSTQLGLSPVGKSEAIAPLVAGAGIVVGAAAFGWAIRETEVIGSDDVPNGISGNAILETSQQRAAARQSVDSTLFTTTQNIISYSRDTAFSKAKLAAFEAINNEKTQSQVETAALAAVDNIQTTTEQNFLQSWNESYRMAHQIRNTIKESPEASISQITFHPLEGDNKGFLSNNAQTEYTYPDGSTTTIEQCKYGTQYENSAFNKFDADITWSPLGVSTDDDWKNFETPPADPFLEFTYGGGDTVTLLGPGWRETWSQMQTAYQSVRDDVILWVEEAYSAVQAGQIDPSSLLSPAERARTYPEEESNAQAVADLAALNIPIESETNVRIKITGRERNPEIGGILGCTDPTKGPFSEGDTITPTSETYTMTFRPSNYIADAPGIDTEYGVQGGKIQWTNNPNTLDGEDITGTMEYLIQTKAGETARVAPGDFTQNSDGVYVADIGDSLSTITVDIESSNVVFVEDLQDEYVNEPVNKEFTIISADGDISFKQPYEPQTSNNYLSESEWQQQEDNVLDLIDKREQEKNDGGIGGIGGGGGGNLFGGGGLPSLPGFGFLESAVLVILGLFGLNAATS